MDMNDVLNIDFTKLSEKKYKGLDSVIQSLPPEHQQLLERVNDGIDYIQENQHMFGCGAECRKNLEEEALYKNMMNAKIAMDNAPKNLEDAEKKFIMFKDGGMEYQKMIEKRKQTQANDNAKKIMSEFNDKYEKINMMIDAYNDQSIYDKYVNDLSDMYKNKVTDLEEENDNVQNKNNVANRNAYYDYQWIQFYKSISGWLKILFWLLVIVYIILAVLYRKYLTKHFIYGVPTLLILGFIPFTKLIWWILIGMKDLYLLFLSMI